MRALIQRVDWAEVRSDELVDEFSAMGQVSRIENGLLVYIGIAANDTIAAAEWMAEKIANLRIFPDEHGKLNKSVQDVRGDVLTVSNFTLLANAARGRRPSFSAAATYQQAEPVYQAFLEALGKQGVTVQKGLFGARMKIQSQASGPVNVIVDSPHQD